jgi:ornithine cyclodeaminase
MIVINEEEVRRHVRFGAVLAAVEQAFVALDAGRSEIFEVVRGRGSDNDHFFGVKSARDGASGLLGLKAGSYVPGNHERDLPAHTSTTLLIDDKTGQPLAVVAANYLNGLRTSAANALATRELARADASTLGIVGIGGQAIFEALAVAHVRPIERILAVGTSSRNRRLFEAAVREQCDAEISFVEAEEAVRNADVLVTVTPSRSAVVRAEWVRLGTHISAMGADNVGKQELDVALLGQGRLWVDHPEQAVRIGEAQHAAAAGLCTIEQLRARTLGGLLSKRLRMQPSGDGITVFDSSGLAVQDIAAAQAAVRCVLQVRQTS